MFPEDSCIDAAARRTFLNKLLKIKSKIVLIAMFDDLHDLLESQAPKGIGALSVYNCTSRIAAWLKCGPTKRLYLHAGPLKGWKKLTGCKGSPRHVPWLEVPAPMRQRLASHQLEDLLCEYRDLLKPEMMQCESF